MTKSFALATAKATGKKAADDRLPFQMEGDDTQLYAYAPSEGQLVLLLGITEDGGLEAASEVMNVFWESLEEDTAEHLRARLRARTDPFGLMDVMNIIEWLVEEAAARPTTPPPASTPSRRQSGPPSTGTARQRASTRSTSRRTASAT